MLLASHANRKSDCFHVHVGGGWQEHREWGLFCDLQSWIILLTLLIEIEGKLEELGVLCIIKSLPLPCHLPWTQHMLR